ncbi:MAG: hypothetical protein IT453_15635 [Planctomycetes bacterium]|nr:hypothetical protein [Planctomycetota bacterium]
MSATRDATDAGERALDRRSAWALFLCLAALYLATAVGLPDNPDAEVEFQTTRSLAREQTFALGETPEARAIETLAFDVVRGVDGRVYSWFGVGQALLAVPFYGVGVLAAKVWPAIQERHAADIAYGFARSEYFEHLFVGLRNPLLGAWTCALVFLAARRLGASRGSSAVAAAMLGVTTYLWPQARASLNDVQATWAFVLAFERWLAWRRSERVLDAVLCGAAAAWVVLTRVALAPAVLVFVLCILVERARAGRAVALSTQAFVAALCGGAALFCGANQARFGRLFETGYGPMLEAGTFFSYPWYSGLAGLVISPGKGVLWFATGVVIAIVGWRSLERRVALCVLLVVIAVFAPVVPTQAWHGAYTFGPRYVLPAVALAWIGVAPVLERAWRSASRPALLALAGLFAFGSAATWGGVAVDTMTHLDLAAQCAREAWPDIAGKDERERDEARFVALQWDLRFAAPFAHWRILAHKVREGNEFYTPRELFGLDSEKVVQPGHAREEGFRHLAWVDLSQRLGGVVWPVWALLAGLFGAGVALARSVSRPVGTGASRRSSPTPASPN